MSLTRYRLILLSIFILAFILRIYQVDNRPHDLYVDEVAIGYNAYSILKTGTDEYGQFLPLVFRSFDEYKLPVYIYITAFSELVFGKTQLAVRMPSVMAGVLTVIFFIRFLNLVTEGRKFGLLGGFFLSVSPWHLQFTRAGFETALALLWIVAGSFYLIKGLIAQSQSRFFAGGAFFILSLYTYHTSRIFTPLIFLIILVLYRKNLGFVFQKRKSCFLTFLSVLAVLPFCLYAISSDGLLRAQSESYLKEVKIQSDNLFQNNLILSFEQFFKNYTRYFSLDYLFFWGDQTGRHSVREMGMNYLYQLPLFLLGIYIAFKNRQRGDRLLIAWYFIGPITASLAIPNPHALRSLPLIIPIIYFVTCGVLNLAKRLGHNRWLSIFTLIAAYFLFSYLHIYYIHYPKNSSPDWDGGYKQAIEYIFAHEEAYQKVLISKNMRLGYIYLYFYGNFPPRQIFESPNHREKIGKYMFVESPLKTYPAEKTLYISPPWEIWHGRQLGRVRNRGNDWVFTIWEN